MSTRGYAVLLAALLAFADQAAAVQMWVNAGSGVYHCPGTRYYQNTKRGELLEESDAKGRGFRGAYGRTCGPDSSIAESGAATLDSNHSRAPAPSAAVAASGRVWVNTSSRVYHCPGTRYFGKTKRGEYLSESDAIARGYRAAYGGRCIEP